MKLSLFTFLFLFSLSHSLKAAESGNRGIYLDLSLAPYFQSDDIDVELLEPELNYKDGTATSITVGYAFNVFHIEMIYSSLGDTGFEYEDYLEYKRETTFLGLNVRWKWRWFSMSLGLGQVSIEGSAKELTNSTQTITYDVDEGANSYSAMRFSVGVNFPISEKFNLYLENVGISWEQDDGKLERTDSSSLFDPSGEKDANETQALAMISVGLRYYLF